VHLDFLRSLSVERILRDDPALLTNLRQAPGFTMSDGWSDVDVNVDTFLLRQLVLKDVTFAARNDRIVQTVALAIPFLITSFITFRDLFRLLRPRLAVGCWLSACVAPAVVVGVLALPDFFSFRVAVSVTDCTQAFCTSRGLDCCAVGKEVK
jgi:hypothetical protein